MNAIYYPSWRDANAVIRYPFVDAASGLSDDTSGSVPDDWLVDAAVFSPLAASAVRISKIELSGQTALVTLSDRDQELGLATIDRLSTEPAAVRDANAQPVATLVPGPRGHAALFDLLDGIYYFSLDQLELVSSCVLWNPSPSALQGFRTGDGNSVITDPLVLVGERGVQLTVDQGSEVDSAGQPQSIDLVRVHAVGDPQHLARECEDASRRPQRFIREIVFQYGDYTQICSPDDRGNILLLAGSASVSQSALQVISSLQGLQVVLAGKGVS